jgi:cytidylate kinase
VSIVIAIDGTSACGKGTLARKLARHYGFAHLDSGALYRLVAMGVIDAGGDPSNVEDAVRSARIIDPVGGTDIRLRSVDVGEAASRVAAMSEVRSAIMQFQQDFAAHPPGGAPGAVIDGRDIGTVICPNATAKLFVDARPAVRALRRWLELKSQPKDGRDTASPADVEEVEAELLARDERDPAQTAPLRRPRMPSLRHLRFDKRPLAKALDLVNDKVGAMTRPQGLRRPGGAAERPAIVNPSSAGLARTDRLGIRPSADGNPGTPWLVPAFPSEPRRFCGHARRELTARPPKAP